MRVQACEVCVLDERLDEFRGFFQGMDNGTKGCCAYPWPEMCRLDELMQYSPGALVKAETTAMEFQSQKLGIWVG